MSFENTGDALLGSSALFRRAIQRSAEGANESVNV
jgi:hypothetical protein